MNRKTATDRQGWLWLAVLLLLLVVGLDIGLALRQQPRPAIVPAQVVPKHPTPVATLPLHYRPATSPEAQPSLTLALVVTDAVTGQPVLAEIWAGGSRVAQQQQALDVTLRLVQPGEKWLRLRVEAAGYETWERDLRFQVLYTRRVDLPVQLQPLRARGGNDGA
jgi:hypothetical protein